MLNESVISVNSLAKTYKLYNSNRDRIKEALHPLRKSYHIRFDALKQIGFSVKKGEVLGILGRNGSGKSTLLKILASVVTPTSGSYSCAGRVTALLELGGGFNKHLSGVENIYFLGGIQGYSRKEMNGRLKEILDFADIGVYADQPVNSYSTGMYIRLAFSMAIHIDPDILIIDEALAVGDVLFQQKCYRKIREFKDAGKTMLLCSHSMGTIRDFCTRAIWLHEGTVMEDGDPIFVTDCYNAFMSTKDHSLRINTEHPDDEEVQWKPTSDSDTADSHEIIWDSVRHCDTYGTGGAIIHQVALYNAFTFQKTGVLKVLEPVRVYIRLTIFKQYKNPGIILIFNGQYGIPLFRINSGLYNQNLEIEIN